VLVAWAALLAVDLWHAALRSPGALGAGGVLWLAALYLVATGLAWLVVRGLLRRPHATAIAIVLASGLACDAAESALRAAPPHAAWRPAAVIVAIVVGAFMGVVLGRVLARLSPRLRAGVTALVVLGGVLGVLGPGLLRRDAAPAQRAADGAGARPNLLLVVIDTLRADHLGCYGYARETSPVLDRLAAGGMLFEHAYAQSSWTKPSTASLLTGRLPSQHQTLSETARLPDAEVTIAERLRDAGYRTAALSANPWVTPEYGFDQGVDDFYSVYDERFARVPLFMQVLKRVSQATDGKMRLYNRVKYLVLGELSTTARDTRIVDEAVRWLDAHGTERFFLYVHMMSPHHPYDPPPPFDRFVPDRGHRPVKNYPRKSYRFFERGDPLPPDDLADLVGRYDGDVRYADTELGRLLDALDRRGLAASTAVMVTADHGEEFYDHGNWGHGQSVYDELVRVPLLLRAPGAAAPTARVTAPVSHADVVPTLLALAGAPAVPALVGRSLVPGPTGDEGGEGDAVAELLYRYGEARALVRGSRKLVRLHDGDARRSAVYDLAVDPGEARPLPADDPVAATLEAELDRRLAAAARDHSAGSEAVTDDDARGRLRGLGYAE
jgi:arylsulfatase A-like enzyme